MELQWSLWVTDTPEALSGFGPSLVEFKSSRVQGRIGGSWAVLSGEIRRVTIVISGAISKVTIVLSGGISKVTILITHIRGLIAILRTTHEPPSRVSGSKGLVL